MKKLIAGTAITLAFFLPAAAFAHGDVSCPRHPKEEWRSHTELQRKLEKDGWVIRRMELNPTCYEVYGKTPDGKRVEAFFDPKTFERVEGK